MKKNKIIYVVALAGVVLAFGKGQPAYAYRECVGGTEVTANSLGNYALCGVNGDCNGAKFCQGNQKMNWWSAWTWCEANGGSLVTWDDICPGTPMAIDGSTGACPNVTGIGTGIVWTAMAKDGSTAYTVSLVKGDIDCLNSRGNRNGYQYQTPLCK